MMCLDPSKRITAREALNHPWISQREDVASHSERQETIQKLKTFLSARARFRAAFQVIKFTNQLARNADFAKDNMDPSENADDDSYEPPE